MAHCAKYTKGAMGHLMKHYERGKDENGEYIKFGNESIDTSYSHLNYNLAPHQNQLDFIHKRLNEVHCLKRKDVNVMCSWVVTAPKELPQEHTREFFERTYNFLEKKYGKENVISSYVHLDETTPHMHFAFVPVVYDKKKDKYKVSAKEVLTKAELKSFHKDLQNEMDKFVKKYEHEFECNVLNGATANGNMSILDLKAQEYEMIAESEREQISELMALTTEEACKLEEVQREVEKLQKQKEHLEQAQEKLYNTLEKLSNDLKTLKNEKKVVEQAFLEQDEIKGIFELFRAEYEKRTEKLTFKADESDTFQSMSEWEKELDKPLFSKNELQNFVDDYKSALNKSFKGANKPINFDEPTSLDQKEKKGIFSRFKPKNKSNNLDR